MAASISLTQEQTFEVLRAFLLTILPSGVVVVQAQTNRVPEPIGSDFVTMTPGGRERLATNITTYEDDFPGATQTRSDMQETQFAVQLDVHGPLSADNVQIISTLFRSDYGVAQFELSDLPVSPLYCSTPLQLPYANGEQQVEERWSIDVYLQVNPLVTVPQQFADQLVVDIVPVDTTYQP